MISIVASWIWNLKSNSILQEKGKEKEGGETKEEKRQEEQEHHFSNIPIKHKIQKNPLQLSKFQLRITCTRTYRTVHHVEVK